MKQDVCCWACRTPFGCGMPSCEHHQEYAAQEEADAKARRVVRRPTEDKAIANIMREQRRKKGRT